MNPATRRAMSSACWPPSVSVKKSIGGIVGSDTVCISADTRRARRRIGSAASETPERSVVAVDTTEVAKLDVEPGPRPEPRPGWGIRRETEGEPKDASKLEASGVPEPGAFEVIVRVMAPGANSNTVWAARGKPLSVFNYGDHPEYGHHIGGAD